MKKSQDPIIDEAKLPDNWKPVEAAPIIPGRSGGVPAAQDLPSYYKGSLSPDMQHDSVLVNTRYQDRIPVTPLVPISVSGSATNNAAIQSVIKDVVKQTTTIIESSAPTPPPVVTGMVFKGVWASGTTYAIQNVVLFNESAYVASVISVGLQPDLNPTSWALLSENLVFNSSLTDVQTWGFVNFDASTVASGAVPLTIPNVTPISPYSGFFDVALSPEYYWNGGTGFTYSNIPYRAQAYYPALGFLSNLGIKITQLPSNSAFSNSVTAVNVGAPAPPNDISAYTSLFSFFGKVLMTATNVSGTAGGSVTLTVPNQINFSNGGVLLFPTLAPSFGVTSCQITYATSTSITVQDSSSLFTGYPFGPTSLPIVWVPFNQVSTGNGGTSGSETIFLFNPTVPGDIAFLYLMSADHTFTLTSINDDQGNTWHTVAHATDSTSGVVLAYTKMAASTYLAVSYTWTGNIDAVAGVFEGISATF